MADDTPDPQRLLKLARQTMSSAERRRKYRRIDFLDTTFWYPTQLKFFAAGSSGVHQRLLYGGSQSGKTTCGAAELAWHVLGAYPPWWVGKRFDKPIRVWVLGESTTLVRDTLQLKLCGGTGDDFGTGTIPLESFARKPIMVAGGTGAIDTAFVAHQTDGKPDGTSTITFKSFEMRREKLQSETCDLIWVDERPSEEVYSELLARTSACDGHLIVTYTPIGQGAAAGVTYKFLTEQSPDRAAFRIAGSEVRHISPERREELAGSYTDAEQRDAAGRRAAARHRAGVSNRAVAGDRAVLQGRWRGRRGSILGALHRWNRFRFRSSVRGRADRLGARHRKPVGDRQLPHGAIERALPRAAHPQHDARAAHSGGLAA
jgi:phage terminase large subunit-like protein